MHTGCAFEHDWEDGTLEIKQKVFAKTMMTQSSLFSIFRLIPECISALELKGKLVAMKIFPIIVLVGSLMWLSVMTRSDIANALPACVRHSHNRTARH